jgi:hypothetical protein
VTSFAVGSAHTGPACLGENIWDCSKELGSEKKSNGALTFGKTSKCRRTTDRKR